MVKRAPTECAIARTKPIRIGDGQFHVSALAAFALDGGHYFEHWRHTRNIRADSGDGLDREHQGEQRRRLEPGLEPNGYG